MDAKKLADEHVTIADVVMADKVDAISSGIVTDDESRTLSVLAERQDALGVRPTRKEGGRTAPTHARKAASTKQATGAAQEHQAHGVRSAMGAEKAQDVRSATGAAKAQGVRLATATEETQASGDKALKVRQIAMREVVSELDDTDEFEGSQDVYDMGLMSKRAATYARSARKGDVASATRGARESGKRAGALGVRKSGAAKMSARTGTRAQAAQHTAAQHVASQATGAVAKRAAASGGSAAVAGTVASTAFAPVAGIVAGTLAFVLVVLMVSQAVSAIFGFWENEASRQSLEGLPPYITYEMVEAALECQETYGHPAGCTIAQIIAESGQGDHMSQLATRDHNLFGIKWASSFAACPEVTGKSSWRTGEVYDGAPVVVTAYFTVFTSDVDCIKFRSRVFLKQSHFANNASIREAIATHDSDKMAEGLKEGGWATSPVYVESLKSIMDTYDLRRFDVMRLSEWKDMDAKAQKILAAAESQLGVPYVWGGSTPGVGLDCSGLTQYCYAQAGVSIGHNTEVQANQLRHVPLSEAKPGDILYRSGHVAIYTGGDQYIHEPQPGDVCKRSTGISYFSYALTYRTA